MKRTLLLLPLLLLGACRDDQSGEPATPQEMYDKAQALIKPNVEQAQSDFAGALQWLHKAAEGGLLRAQLDLGGLYYAGGQGVQPNAQKAWDWFSKAAAQGSREADVFLGMIRYEGLLGNKDKAEALKHWRLAAEAGIPEGQYRLGRVLAQDEGTRAEGMEWLVKASAGVPQAATALGNLYYKYLGDTETAAAWFEKGALAGDPLAQHIYAEMLLLGSPGPKDETRGMAMLRMSAGQDYKPAMARLINILRNGKPSEESEKEAEAWNTRLQELQNQAGETASK